MLKIKNFIFNKDRIEYIQAWEDFFNKKSYISIKLKDSEEINIPFETKKERDEKFDRILKNIDDNKTSSDQ